MFRRKREYCIIHYFIMSLYIPLLGMWYGECKNYIPDYTY